ncbi:efflux RND transporter periplasmic adaptor subunit [Methylocella sp.]|uniref:efflux RND transporter periplasmic adaptor subunit n=1 Tax=Methylocella sp. TaxID=1978226 RepID=UPI003783691F
MDDRTRPPGEGPLDSVYLREGGTQARDARPADSRPSEAHDAAAPAKSPLRTAILILLAGAVAYGTWRFMTSERAAPAGPPSGVQTTQAVGAATVTRGDMQILVSGLGTVTPIATVTVKPQVSGQLIEVGFKEGQNVKKGDFLAQIDPRPFALAKAQYEGQLARDKGLLDQARNNMQRYQTLLKQDAIARQQAEDQVYVVKQYEGAIRADQALIDAQELNLTYARVVSPLDGRVGLRLVDPGNYVQTTDAGLAVITQIDPISVIFTVAEDELPRILDRLGRGATMEVSIFDRGNARKLASGMLSTLDNRIDATTGTVKLRALFPNPDGRLFPNQFVNAQLLVDTQKDAVLAPTTAIQRGAPGTYVYLIAPDDKVSVRPVKLGAQADGRVVVSEGLAPGDRVVVDGVDRLRDGAEVVLAAIDGKAVDAPAKAPPGHGSGERRARQGGAPPP